MPARSTRSTEPRSTASTGNHVPETAATRARPEAIDSERVLIAANSYLVRHFPFGCLGGTPRHLTLGSQELWVVPIVLTSPGYGAVGEVGVLALDAHSAQVVGGTPTAEVASTVTRLKEGKHDDLEAAFHRARET